MNARSARAALFVGMFGMAAPGGDTRVEAATLRPSDPDGVVDDSGSSIDRLLDEAWFQLEIERDPRAAIAAVDAAYGGTGRPRRPMDREQTTRAWAVRLAARALLGVATERDFETDAATLQLPEGPSRMVDAARERVRRRVPLSGNGEAAPPARLAPPLDAPEDKPGDADGSLPPVQVDGPEPIRGEPSQDAIALVGGEVSRPAPPVGETATAPSPWGEVSPARDDVDGWITALDERARAWRSRLRVEDADVEVFALLGRSFAARDLEVDASLAYQVSTYHLARRTRDDVTGVSNAWELSYGNGRSRFDCRMTTDQLSLLYPVAGDSQDGDGLGDPATTLDVATGSRAVLHVERAGAPGGAWYWLEVLESSRARYAIVAFRPESALPIIDRWIDRERRDLRVPRVELGLELRRATTARVCMHGVNSLSGRSDLERVTERGGLVPRGSRYRVDALKGRAVLDPSGGAARVVIAGRVVAEVVGSGERTLGAEGLGLWIVPGEEPTVYLELQGRGRAGVELVGVLVRE